MAVAMPSRAKLRGRAWPRQVSTFVVRSQTSIPTSATVPPTTAIMPVPNVDSPQCRPTYLWSDDDELATPARLVGLLAVRASGMAPTVLHAP
jgi:hypothetical protein